jgi:drug/metabolite transporter (DMT)-like permease
MRFVLIFSPIIIAAIGQLILKSGMNQVGKFSLSLNSLIPDFVRIFSNPLVLLGFFLYFASALLWLIVLSREKLSFVYPLVAFSYVVTVILSKLILKETVPPLRWLGLLIIILGILTVAKSS